MTKLTKTTLSAVALAIAAAASIGAVTTPAHAGYKINPGVAKKLMKHVRVLRCVRSSGDVVAQPIVINTTGRTLPIGKRIYWRATLANGTTYRGTYRLTKPLFAGQGRRIPKQLHWRFICRATVFA